MEFQRVTHLPPLKVRVTKKTLFESPPAAVQGKDPRQSHHSKNRKEPASGVSF